MSWVKDIEVESGTSRIAHAYSFTSLDVSYSFLHTFWSFIIRSSWEVRVCCVKVTLIISALSISTSEVFILDIIISSLLWKRFFSLLLDGCVNLVLVLSKLLEVEVFSITSPDISALPLNFIVFILVIKVIR